MKALFGSASLATTAPWSYKISKICDVFDPGAAHISKTLIPF